MSSPLLRFAWENREDGFGRYQFFRRGGFGNRDEARNSGEAPRGGCSPRGRERVSAVRGHTATANDSYLAKPYNLNELSRKALSMILQSRLVAA